LKAFHRMDGAWLGVIDVALMKAKTSALFEMETQTVDNYSKAGGDAHGLELTNGHLVTFAGGIPSRGCASVAASANATAYTWCANDGTYSPGGGMFASHAESSRMTAMM
jgi:hypothetical protein